VDASIAHEFIKANRRRCDGFLLLVETPMSEFPARVRDDDRTIVALVVPRSPSMPSMGL